MKVELKVENDKELRDYVKELIKGQVISVIRDQFTNVVKDEIERKVKVLSGNAFDNIVRNVLKECIREILNKYYDKLEWGDKFIKPYLNNIFDSTNMDKMIEKIATDLAKERLKSLLS